ncbi:class I SAM-dependent methyltransferase [Rhizobium sp. TRM95111]|uniref:class I SAM-dependent methyltransferase n=1 Tax=Rhizobium alarense TaxID=2846851 RepID=UPI001F182350|nr:class I SAM-dependent methyltransferase [Rhizobium alarense]MCF3638485.1 class I SAM-dependent methyltransferase [Rhizobium alarense]
MPADDRLYDDPALAAFYDLENGWADDLAYVGGLAKDAASVLDLGCGTGALAAALAGAGRRVAGVDPAAAMLAIARARPGAAGVRFVEGDARTVRLGETFDLVALTGHAFQVFLSDRDMAAVLATIAAHLVPHGRFVLDMRNPAAEAWRAWTPGLSERQVEHPDLGPVTAWNDTVYDPASGIATYETHYRPADGRTLSASSRIRFIGRERLAALIGEAGLAVETWLGDWRGAPFRPDAREIIPLGHLATAARGSDA